MDYAVVYFLKDQIFCEIPSVWICPSGNQCFWPKRKNLTTLMSRKVKPDASWEKCDIVVDKYYNSLESAQDHAENRQNASSEEVEPQPKKRAIATSDDQPKITAIPTNDDQFAKMPVPIELIGPQEIKIESEETNSAGDLANSELLGILQCANCDKNAKALDKLQNTCDSILDYVKKVESRLLSLEFSTGEGHTTENFELVNSLKQTIPVDSIDSLLSFDDELKNSEEKRKCLAHILSSIGAKHDKDFVNNMLKRVFTNNLSTKCSWLGMRNNFKVCNLTAVEIMKDIFLSWKPTVTEFDFQKFASDWFRLGSLRAKRVSKTDF